VRAVARSGGAGSLARACVRERECVSTKNSLDSRRSVFINTAQTRISPQESTHGYDWLASGGLLGGLNAYGYVGQRPIKSIDPYGLYAPGHHYECTLEAFSGTSCSSKFRYEIAGHTLQADFDPGSQDVENSHRHGMCPAPKNPSYPEQDAWRVRAYITQETHKCTTKGLGNALHALQDTYAGGHKGCAPWGGGTPSWGHIREDMKWPTAACEASKKMVKDWLSQCKVCCS
jgi:hypothetical protein